jgi:hypothetical protein
MKNAKYFRSFLALMAMAAPLALLAGCEASASADAKTAADVDTGPKVKVNFVSTPPGVSVMASRVVAQTSDGVSVNDGAAANCYTPCSVTLSRAQAVGFFYQGKQLPTMMGPWENGQTYNVPVPGGAAAPPQLASAKPEPAKPAPNRLPDPSTLKLTVWRAEGPSTITAGKCDTDNPVDLPVNDPVQFFVLTPAISDPGVVGVDAPLKVVLRNNTVHVKLDLTGESLRVNDRRELKVRVGGQEFCIATRFTPAVPTSQVARNVRR